jgi:hypothetical protein
VEIAAEPVISAPSQADALVYREKYRYRRCSSLLTTPLAPLPLIYGPLLRFLYSGVGTWPNRAISQTFRYRQSSFLTNLSGG